jgi:Xaa-Pro dipeptidase
MAGGVTIMSEHFGDKRKAGGAGSAPPEIRISNRRDFLGKGLAGFGAAMAVAELTLPAFGGSEAGHQSPGVRGGLAMAPGGSEKLLKPGKNHPEPATFDRLDQNWHKAAIGRLQEKLAEDGIDGVLLSDRWNIIYFTGLFHTSTERPFAIFIPARGLNLTWFSPGLDRDLVGTWWIEDKEEYFDFKHANGGFPNEGAVVEGDSVNLSRWMWKGLRRRGFAGKVIGVDKSYDAGALEIVEEAAPGTKVKSVAATCVNMRMVKTKEEIALTQRAMNYWSRMHAFARDLILERGTDAVDFEIAQETRMYGARMILEDIQRDGRPHNAVGISLGIGCRTGMGTAFPHPNQFHYNKVKRGDALQVAGVIRVGGYGGELYRGYQLHPWDAHREKVWDVHTETCRIVEREARAGNSCSHVAKAVHDYQVKHGVEKYVYHRPAHGEGMEGHQPPYLALGDFTTLKSGMMFSNEPGLYDPENGFGYNHSDNVLITPEGGVGMGSVPWTKEWCFLKL